VPPNKRVFPTGATGHMGPEVLRELADRAHRFEVLALVLPTARGREIAAEFEAVQNLSIVYGDLTDYGDVERCIRGADFIPHTGALVSPAPDDHPVSDSRCPAATAQAVTRAGDFEN
jgi:nucleoside-diphosphate-sugar epimerase